MNLAGIMDELATRLRTIDGWTVYAHPPGRVTPPAAVVGYPEEYVFDRTYRRGMDEVTLPVVVVVGKVSDRAARDALGAYLDGSGSSSIKATLDGDGYTAFDTASVVKAEIDTVMIAGTAYLAAIFDVQVGGQGA